MNNRSEILKKFLDFCREKKVKRSVLKGIPYIGNSIDEYVYGDDLEKLIQHIHTQDREIQSEILIKIETIMSLYTETDVAIITIGSGNLEYIVQPESSIKWGQKHAALTEERLGGSCINHSMRLINTGNNVYPIPIIGNDRKGQIIRDELRNAAIKCCPSDSPSKFINSKGFLIPYLSTTVATIIVHGESRTLFSQRSSFYDSKIILLHIRQRLEELGRAFKEEKISIMLGHIYSDAQTQNSDSVTKYIISNYSKANLLYSNFGFSQIYHGFDFWKDDLKKLDIFQLNIEEIKAFFRTKQEIKDKKNYTNRHLSLIIDILQENEITSVITLERFGAIASYKDGKQGLIFAWPLEIDKIVDPTGAGDAFGAGIVAHLKGKKNFIFDEFFSAVQTGRDWASYACRTLGGSGECPNMDDINECIQNEQIISNEPIEVTDKKHIERYIRLIDRALITPT